MSIGQKSLALGILSCFGGLFLHLIIGSYFQWGFINVYITSYFRITEPELTLQSNGIVFPLTQLCIAPTMKIGYILATKIGKFKFVCMIQILIAAVVFGSSYLPNFTSFTIIFSMGIGLLAGTTFLIPLIECNNYIIGKRMHVNGVILTGTGLGSLIFGQFFYNFLNPDKIPSNDGYYDANLEYIALQVPTCLRWMSLLYLSIGLSGALMMLPVFRHNDAEHQAKCERQQNLVDPYVCPTMLDSLKTPVFYAKSMIIIFAVCGNLLLNGNFKTYVQSQITDDNYLTLIGSIGSVGNACCRFLWNMVFNKIGYRATLAILFTINIIVMCTIRYTVQIQQLYLFMIFVANSCLGGFLVLNITHSHMVFGIQVGSDLDLFFWSFFSFSNFIGYFYVNFLTPEPLGFNNVFYICAAMNVVCYPLVMFFHFESKWTFAQKGIKNQDTQELHKQKEIYDKTLEQIRAQKRVAGNQETNFIEGNTLQGANETSLVKLNMLNEFSIEKEKQRSDLNVESGKKNDKIEQREQKPKTQIKLPPIIHDNKVSNQYES